MRIAIAGHTGRVGQELVKIIENSHHQLVGTWNSAGQKMLENGQDGWQKSEIDVVIDFSLSESFPNILKWCNSEKVPLVSGVTGLGDLTELKVSEIVGRKKS